MINTITSIKACGTLNTLSCLIYAMPSYHTSVILGRYPTDEILHELTTKIYELSNNIR